MLTDGGAMFEAVARAADDEPDVAGLGVAVDQEVAPRRRGALSEPHLRSRGSAVQPPNAPAPMTAMWGRWAIIKSPPQPTSQRKRRYRLAAITMHTGKVRTQASAMLRTVFHWRPVPLAAIVPATPDDRTCVVLTGNPP